MPDCQSIDLLVTPYVDGELTASERAHVDEHLRVCGPCHSRVGAERAVRTLVTTRRDELNAVPAPASLRASCANLAARSPLATAPLSSRWVSRLAPFALAASLVLIVAGAFLYQLTVESPRVMAAELAADHMKCFALNELLGTHQDVAAVESSLAQSFGWDVHLPEQPERAGLELVGSRPCLYGEGRVAHVMFRHAGRPVSLFMLPDDRRADTVVEVFGHEAVIWSDDERTFVLIAGDPHEEVDRIASFVRASMR